MADLLGAHAVSKAFAGRPVLREVSFTLAAGAALGIVGESGAGKTTLLRLLLGLLAPDAGTITWDGIDLATLSAAQVRRRRPAVQAVFQDPTAALHPRQRVLELVGEAPRVHRVAADWRDHAAAQLRRVGLPAELHRRFPHQLSVGQRQRVAVARALALRPRVLLCDEPVAALDASVRGQVLNLLAATRRADGTALLVISHDLEAVAGLCDAVLVLRAGEVVEAGATKTVFGAPQHEYTAALVRAGLGAAAATAP